MAFDAEEKARVEAVKQHAAHQRAKEEANRKERASRAAREPSLIVHGPVSK